MTNLQSKIKDAKLTIFMVPPSPIALDFLTTTSKMVMASDVVAVVSYDGEIETLKTRRHAEDGGPEFVVVSSEYLNRLQLAEDYAMSQDFDFDMPNPCREIEYGAAPVDGARVAHLVDPHGGMGG